MLENKRALYLRRTEMAQEVFALVRAKIAAFTRTPAYGQRLTALLAEALEQPLRARRRCWSPCGATI